MNFLKDYGTTLGLIGVPMSDAAARDLDKLLENVDEVNIKRVAIFPKANLDLLEGERADVSWIPTEANDRDKEVVLSAGMDDSHFAKNPIVTLNHNYWAPPVGRSLWRRRFQDNTIRGVKAKTHYPPRPESWPVDDDWVPNQVFELIKSGLAIGKSIGFLSLDSSPPTPEEIQRVPEWATVRRVVRRWLLIEYAVTWLPANQEAITQATSKSVRYIFEDLKRTKHERLDHPTVVPLETVKSCIKRLFGSIQPDQLAQEIIQSRINKAKGKI